LRSLDESLPRSFKFCCCEARFQPVIFSVAVVVEATLSSFGSCACVPESIRYARTEPHLRDHPTPTGIPREGSFLPACIHSSSSLDFLSLFPSQLIRPQYQTNCSPFCTQTYLAYSSNHVNSPLFSTSSAGSREGIVGAIVLMERLRLNRWVAASVVRDSHNTFHSPIALHIPNLIPHLRTRARAISPACQWGSIWEW
jgi:hypothetical protein